VSKYDDQWVVIVGLARQASALARFFCAQGARVVITDIRPAAALQKEIAALEGLPIEYVLGDHPLTLLDQCDLLCLSGGIPPETPLPQEARRRGIPLSNDSLLTLRLAPAPMIGVTGSSGKTTTTTLVGEILKASGFRTWVGGNIGTPLIDRIHEIAAGDRMVLELSSFQLQLFAEPPPASPYVAAVLNITPNHLDRHPSMAHYIAAKVNILRFQSQDDIVVLNADNTITGQWWRKGRVDIAPGEGQDQMHIPIVARRAGFSLVRELPEGAFLRQDHLICRHQGQERQVCAVSDLKLLGMHNVANVLAACAISGVVGATTEAMRHVVTRFGGVPHRLEVVRKADGVRWYNDSIATTPERVVAALRSFDAPLILIAGGRDKHLPWDEMADLTLERVRHLVLFGEAVKLIAAAIEAARERRESPSTLQVHRCTRLDEAVQIASRVAQAGDVVLFSPGGTSFDAYRDFEERGEHFRTLLKGLDLCHRQEIES
jgi:UDP-N-acetylmuramoylalanine--D-glutamate ligase